MWILQKKAITSLFFVNKNFLSEITCLFRVNTNDSHQRDDIKQKLLCQTVVKKKKKKSHFVALWKETWFIFLKTFNGRSLQVHLLTFRCTKLKRKLYFFEVVKHLLFRCFRVSVCVWYFTCVSFFLLLPWI